uniref:Uncharacterized protein n=1 Tax=uncultured marine virus TaxID=186617 RepID=A0A0F7L2H8_9VIRU|nr:hypothetical protein [uncultured marine virus]
MILKFLSKESIKFKLPILLNDSSRSSKSHKRTVLIPCIYTLIHRFYFCL